MSQLDCEVCKKTKSFTEAKKCNDCNKSNLFECDLDFSECPVCGCKHLYYKKDFNQAVGCIIILIGLAGSLDIWNQSNCVVNN